MKNLQEIKPPKDLDWKYWVKRWDQMQAHYLVQRTERLRTIVNLIGQTQHSVNTVLDLGCGTGSLTVSVLEDFPHAISTGIDFDPTILWLAKARLKSYGSRVRLILTDLRDRTWLKYVPSPFDAVISATALHWFKPDELCELYRQVAQILRPGGILLNADHVGSDHQGIQRAWEKHQSTMLAEEGESDGGDWDSFWNGYSQDLGIDIHNIHKRVIGGWEGGAEEGLPLTWHFDRLRECGFTSVDCFWRSDCDAIYGGITAT
jgi:SAM-dependent methyltransferase